jgi:small ligand-binding sensory domain FIST
MSTPSQPGSVPPGGLRGGRPSVSQSAASFCVLGSDASAVAGAARDAAAAVGTPSGAILFASGPLAESGDKTLLALRVSLGDIPMILASSPGVLTERAEHEQASAVSGLVWRGGTVTPLFVPPKTATDAIGGMLAQQVAAALGDASGTVFLMAEPQGFSPHALDDLARFGSHVNVLGGGTLPGGAWTSHADAKASRGGVVGLVVRGVGRPAVRTASACRILAPLAPITEARGAMIFRLGEKPALDVLTSSTRDLSGRPLVLAALAHPEDAAGTRGLLVRGIRGVDPTRRSVVVTDEALPGMLMSFAICDATAARAELTGSMRELSRQLAGAAPQFGVLMSCAGRGVGLYGERDVDTRIVRERFPNVPFAGMFSTFEIGPLGNRPAMHLYTGVVAMFGAPS